MAKEAYYFSHDANSRNDPKILSMMLDYGIEGYGMFWIVVENLREQDGYKLKQDKSTWRALAMQMHKTVEDSKTFIEECIKEYELFETDGVSFYSLSLLRRMNKKDEVTQKRKDAANARWNKQDNANVMQMHSKSIASAMQLDAKETKLNEKKGKEKKEYTDDFIELYSKYPRPENKRQTFTNYNNLLKQYSHQQLITCVDNYILKVKADGTSKQYMKSSSNFLGKDAIFEDYLITEFKKVSGPNIMDLSKVEVQYVE